MKNDSIAVWLSDFFDRPDTRTPIRRMIALDVELRNCVINCADISVIDLEASIAVSNVVDLV